jgi:parvulin-like peptidyl-prolyl cis-trans isomerase-like protein
MRFVHLSFLLVALLLSDCRQQQSGHVIARVGDAELTLEEAKSHIDTTRAAFDYALNDYVSYWVNTELLYQEAKRQGVESSPEFTRQLEDVRRQLANQTFLERFVYSDTTGVTPEAMQLYFQQHAAEFQIHETTLQLNLAALSSRDLANAFAASVTKGTAWPAAVENILHDSASASSLLSVTQAHYYTIQTLFPPELWKVASALSINEVSFPVKAAGGYFVLQCLARFEQGSPAQFGLAGPEVRQRLLIESRRHNYDELLGTLRKKASVELMLGSPRTADSAHAHE